MDRTGSQTPATSIAAGVALLMMACQGLVEPLPDPPSVEATVADFSIETSSQNRMQTLWVNELPEELVEALLEAGGPDLWPEPGEIRVEVSASFRTTAYFIRGPSGLSSASMDDVRVGDRIQIWINSELRSLPPVWGAEQIVILRE